MASMAIMHRFVWIWFTLTYFAVKLVAAESPNDIARICTTNDVNHELLREHLRLTTAENENEELWNSIMVSDRIAMHKRGKRQSRAPGHLLTIPTHVHIVSDMAASMPNTSQYVSLSRITQQITYLNTIYNTFGIAFMHSSTTRTVNSTWAANRDDRAMKTSLRRGSYSELNIYYQTNLQTSTQTNPGIPAGQVLLGFCSLPTSGVTRLTPRAVYVLDGCNVLARTLPGGDLPAYSQGGTTVHEIGHWLGLLHTFQDYTCSPTSWGDYVADTPQQSRPSMGCPLGQDSCPSSGAQPGDFASAVQGLGLPSGSATSSGGQSPHGPQGFSGQDPVTNFMDYSDDQCYAGFSMGQVARMLNVWALFRLGK